MDNLNPSEISEIIKGRIDSLETSTTESNEGTIVFLSDGIARVHGLSDAMYGELIEFEGRFWNGTQLRKRLCWCGDFWRL